MPAEVLLPVRRLPYELEVLVLHEHQGSPGTLSVCVIVSKSWSSICYPLLYRFVRLDHKTRFDRFVDSISIHPQNGTRVQGLHLYENSRSHHQFAHLSPLYLPRRLPNLESLEWHGYATHDKIQLPRQTSRESLSETVVHLPHQTSRSFLLETVVQLHPVALSMFSHYGTVRALKLHSLHFSSSKQVHNIVCALPSLFQLEISNISWLTDSRVPLHGSSAAFQLQTVTMSNIQNPALPFQFWAPPASIVACTRRREWLGVNHPLLSREDARFIPTIITCIRSFRIDPLKVYWERLPESSIC